MQKHVDSSLNQSALSDKLQKDDDMISEREKNELLAFDLEDGIEKKLSIKIWKHAFSKALERLCPIRAKGGECGCIPGLASLVIEQCVIRLDVSMFNAILRSSEDEAPTDPISDPISDPQVLPIPPRHFTFGAGAQLKNVVVTWSTWITNLLEKHVNIGISDVLVDDVDRFFATFPLLQAVANLLMLPKEMIIDKSVRKEVFPMLTLPVIRQILLEFEPDAYSPDPIAPSLLAAISAEVSLEKRLYGDAKGNFSSDGMALAPGLIYLPQLKNNRAGIQSVVSHTVSDWSNTSLPAGVVSDEIDELKEIVQLSLHDCKDVMLERSQCVELSSLLTPQGESSQVIKGSILSPGLLHRFDLLKNVWITNCMS